MMIILAVGILMIAVWLYGQLLGYRIKRQLIHFPYLWLKCYPLRPGQSRIAIEGLTASEKQFIERKLPESIPPVRLIREAELDDLLRSFYETETELIAGARWRPYSEKLLDHLKCLLLKNKTIIPIADPNQSLYGLKQMSYAPKGINEKLFNLIKDGIRFLKLLLQWVNDDSQVLRAVETFEICPGQEQEAFAEMDTFLRSWADKYHQDGGTPMILQAAIGPDDSGAEKSRKS